MNEQAVTEFFDVGYFSHEAVATVVTAQLQRIKGSAVDLVLGMRTPEGASVTYTQRMELGRSYRLSDRYITAKAVNTTDGEQSVALISSLEPLGSGIAPASVVRDAFPIAR